MEDKSDKPGIDLNEFWYQFLTGFGITQDELPDLVQHTINYIKKEIPDIGSVECILEQVNYDVSREHLEREFTKFCHISLWQFVILAKLYYAIQMIHRQYLIKEIVHKCGFYDTSHFYRTFKKFTGITPYEYRQKDQYVDFFALIHAQKTKRNSFMVGMH